MAATILVIEDERLTRKNLVDFLTSEGFDPLEAANGSEGIELAQTHYPDLIICDILMPDLDGYDVLITLQQHPRTAAIPFIFLTVSATEDGFRQGLALGADDYLSKPVTSEQLRTAITAQLRKTDVSLPTELPPALMQEGSPKQGTDVLTSLMATPLATSTSVSAAKAQLLEMLCPVLKQRLIGLREIVELLQKASSEEVSDGTSQKLRDEFVRLLSLVNEATALQTSLTPENAQDLLEIFVTMLEDGA